MSPVSRTSNPTPPRGRVCLALALVGALLASASSAPMAAGPPSPPPPPEAPAPADLVGGDLCGLVEGVPAVDAPLRTHPKLKSAFRTLDRAEGGRSGHAKAYAALSSALERLLSEGRRTFQPSQGDVSRAKARRFLSRWVLGRDAVLRVGEVGFAPVPPLRAALVYSACRSGRQGEALAWARRAEASDEAAIRAFAALAVLADSLAGAREQAARLVAPDASRPLADGGFLEAYVRAELATSEALRRGAHGWVRRRVATSAQQAAARAQAQRFAGSDPGADEETSR